MWTNRVGGPELEQQTFEVLPFPMNLFSDRLWEGVWRANADKLNPFGFDSFECRDDPLSARLCLHKLQMFKFCGHGEVK